MVDVVAPSLDAHIKLQVRVHAFVETTFDHTSTTHAARMSFARSSITYAPRYAPRYLFLTQVFFGSLSRAM